jgi:hypothetical protein
MEPIQLNGTLLKRVTTADEEILLDFGHNFYVNYDHQLRKFYVLLRNEESVFAVVEDLKYLLPESDYKMPSEAPSTFK